MEKNEPIVVFGIPRSGSTWFARVLTANRERVYLHEPDNEKVSVMGHAAKDDRFPLLKKDEVGIDKFIGLFQKATHEKFLDPQSLPHKFLMKLLGVSPKKVEKELCSGKKSKKKFNYVLTNLINSMFGSKRNRVVKSVHGILSIPILVESVKFKPVIIFRHPAAVVASMIKLKMPDADRKIYDKENIKEQFNLSEYELEQKSQLELMGLQVGIFYWFMNEAINEHKIPFYLHENLCKDVGNSFRSVYKDLGLNWNNKVTDYIKENNKPGSGYDTQRVASKQIHKWKDELREEEIEQIRKGYMLISQKHYNEPWI